MAAEGLHLDGRELHDDDLLTPAEVARLVRVDTRTVAKWRKAEILSPAVCTPGGHYRYRAAAIRVLLVSGDAARGGGGRDR